MEVDRSDVQEVVTDEQGTVPELPAYKQEQVMNAQKAAMNKMMKAETQYYLQREAYYGAKTRAMQNEMEADKVTTEYAAYFEEIVKAQEANITPEEFVTKPQLVRE